MPDARKSLFRSTPRLSNSKKFRIYFHSKDAELDLYFMRSTCHGWFSLLYKVRQ